MTYEQIYKVIELYHQYEGMLNDDGTLADDAQIAVWIHPSVEEDIDEDKLDELAESYVKNIYGSGYTDFLEQEGEAFKEGYRKAKEE